MISQEPFLCSVRTLSSFGAETVQFCTSQCKKKIGDAQISPGHNKCSVVCDTHIVSGDRENKGQTNSTPIAVTQLPQSNTENILNILCWRRSVQRVGGGRHPGAGDGAVAAGVPRQSAQEGDRVVPGETQLLRGRGASRRPLHLLLLSSRSPEL